MERTLVTHDDWKKNATKAQILCAAQEIFRDQLSSPEGQIAQDYLNKRGFTPEQIKNLGFGYTLNHPRKLIDKLLPLNYSIQDLEEASLASSYGHNHYDFFRHRLTIPIHDKQGKLIAFGGRALGEQQQKYKNSRYDKGQVLFGLYNAKQAIRQKSQAIVVEGYLDALQLQENGFKETVACQGTSLTSQQLKLLSSLCGLVYIIFDGDAAGTRAYEKLLKSAIEVPNILLKVVKLPSTDDPDSFIRNQGGEELKKLLNKAEDLIPFIIRQRFSGKINLNLNELDETLNFLIQTTQEPIQKEFILQEIVKLLGLDKKTLQNRLSLHEKRYSLDHKESRLNEEKNLPLKTSKTALLHPPSEIEQEYISQLFLSSPQELELELEKIDAFIKQYTQYIGPWKIFVDDILTALALRQEPAKSNFRIWTSYQEQVISQFIENLLLKKEAFFGQNRLEKINHLQLIIEKKNLRNTLSSLKKKLSIQAVSQTKSEKTWQQTALSIQKLCSELKKIDERLKQNNLNSL